jgi:hypothetical protein
MAKLKEVTVEDIEQKYVKEVFEDKLITAINSINTNLVERFESVVERELLRIKVADLGIGSLNSNLRDNLVEHLDNFYSTWSIFLQGVGGVMYLQIEPDTDFDITTDVKLLKVERQELQKSNDDESVDNRADILDL